MIHALRMTLIGGIVTLPKPKRVVDTPGACALQVRAGDIRFERVGFGYGGERWVIEGLDRRICPGAKIGLVGRSDAGRWRSTPRRGAWCHRGFRRICAPSRHTESAPPPT